MPKWEENLQFNPTLTFSDVRKHPTLVTMNNSEPLPAVYENISDLLYEKYYHANSIPVRDPKNFIAGGINDRADEWIKLFPNLPSDVKQWITDGVSVTDFLRHFKGNFKGKSYDSIVPPKAFFLNSSSCKNFIPFIQSEICNRLKSGSVRLWGKLGECELPKIIMPLTIEPSKPRLCHDERYLNLWIKDCPFQLENLKHVPRIVNKNSLMVAFDEKSGYDHIKLHKESEPYFGFQFGGWIFTYTVIPFGWKASAYIYQTVGMQITSYLRSLGINTIQYIDDRLLVANDNLTSPQGNINKISVVMLEILTKLGYTLSLKKCRTTPSTEVKYLGFIIDSVKQAFILPQDKKLSFISLRDFILKCEKIDVNTLQRFAGKCVSMNLVVPAAKLYCREVNAAIARGIKNTRAIDITGDLKIELEHWKFIDNWDSFCPWRTEMHKQLTVYTDSSMYKYGVSVLNKEELTFGDFWDKSDERPIHAKEADAVIRALQSLGETIRNHRVDILTDNQSVISAWDNQGARDKTLNDLMKELFTITYIFNIDLHMTYVPTDLNEADQPSRSISYSDSRLNKQSWFLVEEYYGPHTIDLMSLDSNVMTTKLGTKLRHFTPAPSPLSAGVNLFAQELSKEENPYVNPPFTLIFPVLNFLKEQRVRVCTLIAPELIQIPQWYPLLKRHTISSIVIGDKGQKGVLDVPSKKGYIPDTFGLKSPLLAYRLSFA